MHIVGHPDDDLLFQSPDLLHDVQAGKCVRTVYVTAGERGDTDLMLTREAGMKAAYANMSGVASAWTTTDAGISGHPMPLDTLSGKPTVSLVFIRLPEGFWGGGGTSSTETIKNLWQGSISQIHTDDGTSTYTSASLTSTLTALMDAFQPDTIRTQDYVGTFGDGDHDDHHATGYYARQAHLTYHTSHTFIGYQDYETQNRPQNVTGADLTAKTNAFNAYLQFDEAPCGSPPNCGNNEYGLWLKRQYVKATESGSDTTPPTVQSVTPQGGATNVTLGTSVSATFSEAIAPASVTGASFVLRDPGGNAVAASVSASGATATLQPNSPLTPSTTYTATLLSGSNGIKDASGNALASDFSWSFTTAILDTTPPTTATTFPADSSAYNAAGWNGGCPSQGLCGTASDGGSGVQKVEISFRRLSNNRYWNGITFSSITEVWLTAAGTASWIYSFPASSFPGAGSYTVRVRATDNSANVSAPVSTTFLYDNTNPSSTATFPVANGSYTTLTWTAGCVVAGVCGTASDASSGVKRVEVSIRRGATTYWNGTSFSSTTEIFLPATGTTSWSFAFPASNFPAAANYRIRVRATDNAGNVQSPSTRTITFSP